MKDKVDKVPFKLQAAKASWVIPLINIGVMAFGKGGFKTQEGTLIMGGLIIFLLLVGIVLGVIGLSGYKEYGVKSTAVPSVLGLTLNVGLLYALLSAALDSYNKAMEEAQ